ncbi:50S ribosomal protein L10 [Candidatus Omnitrophota bacterium]
MEKELKPGKLIKNRLIQEYAERLTDVSLVFVTEFGGLTSKQIDDLRNKLRPFSARYLIVKNSLCRTALKGLNVSGVADLVDGACAISYGEGDPVSISKVLVDFAKKNNSLKLRGGYLDGKIISVDTIKELASLPSREVLLARLLSCMNSPISGLVSVCSGVIKKLLYALNEIAKKNQPTNTENKEE